MKTVLQMEMVESKYIYLLMIVLVLKIKVVKC